MVTAPAAVTPDSHTLPLNSAGAVLNTSKSHSSTNFHTVYDSLPNDQNYTRHEPSSDSSSSKEPRTKRDSQRHPDNSLTVATAQPVVANVAPPRNWAPPAGRAAATHLGQQQDAGDSARILNGGISNPGAIDRLTTEPASGMPVLPDSSSITEAGPLLVAAALPTAAPAPLETSASVPAAIAALKTSGAPLPETAAALPDASAAVIAASAPPAVSQALPAANETLPDKVAPRASAAKDSGKLQVTPSRSLNPKDVAAAPTSSLIAPTRDGGAQDNSSPDSRTHAGIPFRETATGTAAQPSIDSVIHKGLADAIVPRSENLAFSLRMREADSLTHGTPAASAPAAPAPRPSPARTQPVSQPKDDERASESQPDADAIRAQSHTNMAADYSSSTAHLVWSEAAAAPRVDTQATVQMAPRESADITAVAAMHEAHPVLPETPKGPTAGEILLQLGGKDQPAAIRISERAGNVNVAVHAADPDLRSSLRSNLGELASQLAHQGWKTDAVKSATAPRPGDSPQDSHQDGQRSPGQQQAFSQQDRQPQRDRRANGGRWLAEFEEQSSGKPGGKN